MRHVTSTLRLVALLAAGTFAVACGGGEAQTSDSAATAAPPPPAAPESFTLEAKDGSWSAEINPQNIVWIRHRGSRSDSVVFDFKEPSVNGAISEYEVLRTSPDTTRISIALAMTSCTDDSGNTYTHQAQVWLTGKTQAEGAGCAKKK